MPFLQTPNATLYYDVFEPDATVSSGPIILLLHGFAGTPESDFAGQLPSLRTRYCFLAPHHHGYWRSLPAMYVAAQEALVAAGGVLITEQEMASIRCPALIMHGALDRVVPADYSRIIHEHIPGSRLLVFDAGHAAHLRCEKEYTAVVMDFFLEQESDEGESGIS